MKEKRVSSSRVFPLEEARIHDSLGVRDGVDELRRLMMAVGGQHES